MNKKQNLQTIILLDFGAQYSQLIARRVRECKVYSEILPYDTPLKKILEKNPLGIILTGGPSSVYENNAPQIDKKIFKQGIPILGICYGMQLIAHLLQGKVEKTGKKEYGKTRLEIRNDKGLFKNLPLSQTVWMSHSDTVREPPRGFIVSANTETSPAAAIESKKQKIYGVQFHPEVIHTPYGMEIIKNFLYKICGCKPTWTKVSIIEEAIQEIRTIVGKNKIICGLSGGVDSSVAAVLVHKALGNQLTCVFVDHGLLRKGEAEEVIRTFKDYYKINLISVKAEEKFLKKLKGVLNPEMKRRIIGEEFIHTFEAVAIKLKNVDFLVQGTLYPDVIESGTRDAARIKSHHNVGGLPETMKFKLIEPLRLLFKDEVREIGEELGLPEEIVWRQPFPGPGLAIRIIGEVTKKRLEILREADAIVTDEIRRAGLYRKLWQSFAILPCIKSVGVMGDGRTYGYPIVLRAITSEDAMTADWARLPHHVLELISNRITNEVLGVNRVVYDISSKPPGTIEWE